MSNSGIGGCAMRASAVAMIVAASNAAFAAPPANDDCSDPITIQLGQTPFTTAEATSAGPGVCVNFGKDIWFKHRAKWNAKLKVSLCDNANFDTVIAMYRGTSCNDNTLITNMIGCNDDKTGCPDGTSELIVNVVKDQVYLIRVGGFNADSGSGVLTLSCGDPESAACAEIVKTGLAPEDRFGYAIGGGGLMDSGNDADIAVGAYLNDLGGSNAGRVSLFTGNSNGTMDNSDNIVGEAAEDNFGFAVATGDVNNDGRLDIIVGAPLNDEAAAQAGKVYVFDGFNGGLLWSAVGQTAGDRFGNAVGFAGDIDDDGFGDVIVGAPFNDAGGTSAGRAYILDGENGNRLRTHTGQNAGDQFGTAVAGVRDLNDDGNDDYIIGEPRNDQIANDAGRATIFNGDTGGVLIRLTGDAAGDRFGSAIASDRFTVTFDYTFIVIGAPFNDAGGSNAGRARIFFRNHDQPNEGGCNKLVCLRYTINGANAGGRLGSSVAMGDVVGNAATDAIVGAPFTSAKGNNSGAAFVFDGNGGALAMRFFGEAAGDRFGTSVAFADDIDDDGNSDIFAGAPFSDAGGTNAGRAYGFLIGSGGALLRSAAPQSMTADGGDSNDGQLPEPPSNAIAGDVTFDGRVDVNDLLAVITAFGPCDDSMPDDCPADVDGSGQVDVNDLLLVIGSMQG